MTEIAIKTITKPLDKPSKAADSRSVLAKIEPAIDRVFVDEKEVNIDWTTISNGLFEASSSKYERTVAALQFVNKFVPGSFKDALVKNYPYSQDKLPFNPDEYLLKEKIGGGGVNDAYLLESQIKGRHHLH